MQISSRDDLIDDCGILVGKTPYRPGRARVVSAGLFFFKKKTPAEVRKYVAAHPDKSEIYNQLSLLLRTKQDGGWAISPGVWGTSEPRPKIFASGVRQVEHDAGFVSS